MALTDYEKMIIAGTVGSEIVAETEKLTVPQLNEIAKEISAFILDQETESQGIRANDYYIFYEMFHHPEKIIDRTDKAVNDRPPEIARPTKGEVRGHMIETVHQIIENQVENQDFNMEDTEWNKQELQQRIQNMSDSVDSIPFVQQPTTQELISEQFSIILRILRTTRPDFDTLETTEIESITTEEEQGQNNTLDGETFRTTDAIRQAMEEITQEINLNQELLRAVRALMELVLIRNLEIIDSILVTRTIAHDEERLVEDVPLAAVLNNDNEDGDALVEVAEIPEIIPSTTERNHENEAESDLEGNLQLQALTNPQHVDGTVQQQPLRRSSRIQKREREAANTGYNTRSKRRCP